MESNAGGIFIAVAGIIGTAAFFYNKNTTSTKVSKTEAKVPRKMKTTKRKEKKIIKESKPINMADYINVSTQIWTWGDNDHPELMLFMYIS